LKKYSALLLSLILIFTTFPNIALAKEEGKYSSKDEVIYANLTPNGKTDDMYVVNSFQVTEPGSLVDYGPYESVRNLTDLTDITLENDNEVHFEAESKQDFFYQGTLDNQALPWNISITYVLDGEEIKPNELAGKSGQLEIQIETSENTKVDPVFFEYYLLQIEMTLDPLHFENIQAPEGTEANDGKDKLISFNVMPEEEEVLIASADVTDFELEPIQISAVPANIGFEDPDTEELTEEMQELSDAISEINEGVADLEDGALDLSDGASQLSIGSNEFLNGINELSNSSGELVSGSNEILNAFNQINNVMDNMPDIPSNLDEELNEVPKNLKSLASGLREFSQGIEQFNNDLDKLPEATITSEDIKKFSNALDNTDVNEAIIESLKQLETSNVDQETIDWVVEQLKETDIDPEVIDDIVDQLKESNNDEEVAELIKQLEESDIEEEVTNDIVNQLDMIAQAMEDLQAIESEIPDDSLTSIQTMANELDNFADGLEGAIGNLSALDQLDEFKNGLTQLSSEYQTFHNGLISYTDGVNALAQSYKELNNGTQDLANGSADLADGISDLREGTEELADETSDLPEQFNSEIDEFMDEFDFSDFEPISYVSDENKDVNVVQFILQTEKIEVEEADEEPVEEEEDKNIWTRFLDLFR